MPNEPKSTIGDELFNLGRQMNRDAANCLNDSGAFAQHARRVALYEATLKDLLEIAEAHDTGELYERLETYRQQLKELK